jgi:hypothetical protein
VGLAEPLRYNIDTRGWLRMLMWTALERSEASGPPPNRRCPTSTMGPLSRYDSARSRTVVVLIVTLASQRGTPTPRCAVVMARADGGRLTENLTDSADSADSADWSKRSVAPIGKRNFSAPLGP